MEMLSLLAFGLLVVAWIALPVRGPAVAPVIDVRAERGSGFAGPSESIVSEASSARSAI